MKTIPKRLASLTLLVCAAVSTEIAKADDVAIDDARLVMRETTFRIGNHLIEGDRGHLLVQENRENGDSQTIEIAFVRFRGSEAETAPPVVYLPGGPGQTVLNDVEGFAATYKNYRNLGGRSDMLVVEQRGIGESKPRLDCPDALTRPDDRPLSANLMGITHKQYVEQCIEHWVNQGVDPAGYDVLSMVEDIDELRAALGYEKIKLIGESFGAHHALALIANHGEHIESAVLSAVIGPDDMFELPAQVDQQLTKVERRAIDDQRWKKQASMTSVLAGLDQPVDVNVSTDQGDATLMIGRYDLALATVTLSRYTSFLRQLPTLYETVADGDLNWLAGWSAQIRNGQRLNLASLLITCASGASSERRSAITTQTAGSLFGDVVNLLDSEACPRPAGKAFAPHFQMPASIDIPILMISGELDPRAPPSNAEAILPALTQGHHVVFPNVSHDFGNAREAQLELAYRFLARGETQPNPALLPPNP